MSARAKHEASIKRNETYQGREFTRALWEAIHAHGGMSFFTDDQVEEIRARMVHAEWFSHRTQRENRRRRAA